MIHRFMHSLRHKTLMMPLQVMEAEVEDSEDRRRHQNKSRDIRKKRLTAQQMDERQDNHDRKQLAHQHPSDLLRSLTHVWIGRGQHGII